MTAHSGKFRRVHEVTLKWEGGYVNHPKDPGGATNQGVTQATYNQYRDDIGKPRRSVRDMTVEEREHIYRVRYWDRVRGDDLPVGVDLTVYDFGVNSGPSRSVKYLQRVLGVTRDGVVGVVETLPALRKVPARVVIAKVNDARLGFVQGLRTWSTFGKGWARRIGEIRALSLVWAGQSADVIRKDTKDVADSAAKDRRNGNAAGAGSGASGGAGGAQQMTEQGAQIDWTVIAVFGTAALVLLAVAVVFYFRAKAKREAAEAEARVLDYALQRGLVT